MKLLQYFYFTRSERNGAILLLLLSISLFVIPELRYRMSKQTSADAASFLAEAQHFRALTGASESLQDQNNTHASALFSFDPNTASLEQFVSLGLDEKTARTICNYRNKGGQFRTPDDFKKIWELKADDYERLYAYIRIGGQEKTQTPLADAPEQAFMFDPNTADESALKNLGLPSRTIKSILNYRTKGGHFKSKADFQKIYTLNEDDYVRLEPFIQITTESAAPPSMANPTRNTFKAAPAVVNINQASAEQWQSLPGIGETRARQIINLREKLGGFISVGQVAETRYLPDSIFQKIRPHLALESGQLRQININTIELEALAAHPYFSKKQAVALVEYRKQHGPYRSVADLSAVIVLKDQAWLEKVRPYLAVD